MSWPLQSIGPRPADATPIAPVDRTRGTERRRERDEDGQERKRRREHEAPEGQTGPDADGHIDVLA